MVEFLDRILPGMDAEVGKQFQRILQKQGMTFKLSSKVTAIDSSGKTLKASVEPAAGGAAETIEADVALIAIGRVPYTEGLGLDELGVAMERGRVTVDAHFATNVAGIYAIGDVIAGPMLAHKAEDEGIAVAEILAGQAGHVNYDAIPNVIYTYPEVASVGKTEEELKAAGVAYNVGKFPFTANGRAKVNRTTDGFVKILADAKNRPRARRAHRRRRCRHHDHGGDDRDGVRRLGGGHRAHLPRAPDAVGSGEGGRAGGRQARDPYVMSRPRRSELLGAAQRCPAASAGMTSDARLPMRRLLKAALDSARARLPVRGVAVGASAPARRAGSSTSSAWRPAEGAARRARSSICRPTRRCSSSSSRSSCCFP